MFVPLETVRGVYEKLSREAVEAQLTRPLPGRRIELDRSDVSFAKNGYHGDAGDLDTGLHDDVSVDDDDVGRKSVLQRTAAAMQDGQMNGRTMSAPTTPMHRPPPPGTDHEVTDDELPQRGLTQALVAQWREIEQRARAELVYAGTSRSRSMSGMAVRQGESPSPCRRPDQGRSDDGSDNEEDIADCYDQGRSGPVRHQRGTVDVTQRRDLGEDGEDEGQLPPPLMTQYMLAKFRDMEADKQIAAGLQAKDRKVNQSVCVKPSLCTRIPVFNFRFHRDRNNN